MPKFKLYNDTTGAYQMAHNYTTAAESDVQITIRAYLNANNVQGKPETEFLLENSEAIVNAAVEDRLETEGLPEKEKAEAFARLINPDYRPLTESEARERKALSDDIQKKYTEFIAKRSIVEKVIGTEYPKMDRTMTCLLSVDLSPEGMEYNRHIAELITSGDPKKEEQGYREAIDRFMQVDLKGIDLLDDRYPGKHMERLYPLLSSSVEFALIADKYQQYHDMDLANEKDRAVFEQMGAMAEIGMQLRKQIDMIASPSYAQLRTEDLRHIPSFIDLYSVEADKEGNTVSADTFLFGSDVKADSLYMSSLFHITMENVDTLYNPMTDPSLSPDQRPGVFKAQYWDRAQQEVKPLFHEERKKAEAQLRKNIAEIKKILPDFKISEEEIRSYVSPERFRLRERAQLILKDQAKRKTVIDAIPHKPDSFNRSAFVMVKDPGTEEGREFNRQFAEKLLDPGYKGQDGRKELFAEYVEKIKALDTDKFRQKKFSEETASYILDNMDTLIVGTEFGKTNDGKKASMCFTENPELTEDLKKVEDKGVVLGGIGGSLNEIMNSEIFFTIPFDHLSSEEAILVNAEAAKDPGRFGLSGPNEFSKLLFFNHNAEQVRELEEPSDHTYTRGDFTDTPLPDIEAFRQYTDTLEQDLKKTEHWYNRLSSSSEYSAFRKSVRELKREFRTWPDTDPEKLHKAINAMQNASDAYQNHVQSSAKTREQKKGKNATQQARFKAAGGVGEFLRAHYTDINVLGMAKHAATVKPEEREAHQRQMTQEQKLQREKAKKELEEQKADRQLAKRAADKTASIETGLQNLPEGNMKELRSSEVDMRKTIAGALSSKKFSAASVRDELATLITSEMMQKALEGKPDMPSEKFSRVYLDQTEKLKASEPFRELVSGLTKEDVAFMLQDDRNPTRLVARLEDKIRKGSEKKQSTGPEKELSAPEKAKEDLSIPV